jgi:hypothetical protein
MSRRPSRHSTRVSSYWLTLTFSPSGDFRFDPARRYPISRRKIQAIERELERDFKHLVTKYPTTGYKNRISTETKAVTLSTSGGSRVFQSDEGSINHESAHSDINVQNG